jgi:hypothetical protein
MITEKKSDAEKWSLYFEQFGCMGCGTTLNKGPRGFCAGCTDVINQQLKNLVSNPQNHGRQ